jgi:glycosyltransferase involved in cell wall biosynthesis
MLEPMTTPRQAAVFNTNFLPYSQTFVYEQLVNHQRYEAEVFCWRTENLDWFPFPNVHRANLAYGVTRFSPSFYRRFAQKRFDIVHAHFAPGAVYALPYVLRANLPFAVTFHGYDVPLLWNTRRFRPQFWPLLLQSKRMLERMTLGLCASNDLRELLLSYGVPEEKLRVHRLGVDLTRFRMKSPRDRGPLRVCVIGRFVEKKGIDYAIRAFAPHASESHRLDIIGDGPLNSELRALVERLGIHPFVSFLGVLKAEHVAEHLRKSDVLLAPSVVNRIGERESGLIVVKEAAASGVPAVGTVHGGIPEIIDDGVTGYLVQERDVQALSDRLGKLLTDAELRERMGRAAREKMERQYDVRKQVAELEGLYDEAIELFHRAPRSEPRVGPELRVDEK